jgi:hypothetical protein
MFPFQGILQHYVEFDIHTITTLENYLVWDLLVVLLVT